MTQESVLNAVNHVVGVTPARLQRPKSRITSRRGLVGTVDNDSVNPSTSFVGEPAPRGGAQFLNLKCEDGSFRVLAGAKDPVDFEPADVTVLDDTVDETGHGYFTGEGPFQLTSATTLPAGLALATDYFIIVVDDDTYKFATTRDNANTGVAVDITDQGTGTHTITGLHNVANPPSATLSDDSGSVEILPGDAVVSFPAAEFFTVVGFAASDVLTYWWS